MKATGVPSVTADNMLVVVFTYERPRQLERCVASIERNMPDAALTIYDDGSESRSARTTLGQLRGRYDVVSRHVVDASSLGGLHANMNTALDLAMERGVDYLFLVQDDQRVVRRADSAWSDHVRSCFMADAGIGEVVTVFPAGWLGDRYYAEEFAPDPAGLWYENRHPFGTDREPSPDLWGMFDTGLLYLPRLAERGFRFGATEWASASRARELGLRSVWSRDPLTAFVPWPATRRRARGRTTPPAIQSAVRALSRVNEWGVRAGTVDLHDMEHDDVDRLISRPIGQVPIAEHFLVTDGRCRTPWFHSRCFDARKYRGRYLFRLSWLFDGPVDYIVARERHWATTRHEVRLPAAAGESSEVAR